MENATKALLIAAAVLVAILVISLGLVVYNMASETIDSVNFSGQEITAFNDKFEQYAGTNKRVSEVKAMLKTVLNSNLQSRAEGLNPNDGVKFVEVKESEFWTGSPYLQKSDTSLPIYGAPSSNALYTIKVDHDAKTGFVNRIAFYIQYN